MLLLVYLHCVHELSDLPLVLLLDLRGFLGFAVLAFAHLLDDVDQFLVLYR